MSNRTTSAAQRVMEDGLERANEATLQGGGLLATVISAVALIFSAYSYYETAMRSPDLGVYVPPRIDYTDPNLPDDPFEVFVLPLTINNDGARTGTVLSMDLDVTNRQTGQTKRFYAAQLGVWGQEPRQPFTPVALSGKTSFSNTVQFFPRMSETIPRIIGDEPGAYVFELNLRTTQSKSALPFLDPKVRKLRFEKQIGKLNYFNFDNNGTMAMWSADFAPAQTSGQ